MKVMTILFLAITILLTEGPSIFAQRHLSKTGGVSSSSVRIDPTKPHIFISYVGRQRIEGEKEDRIFLQIDNNSKWEVRFCSDAVPPSAGAASPYYDVERFEGTGDVPDTGHTDTCGYYSLLSGKAAVFSVPKSHLAPGLLIRIQFRYIWEFDSRGSDDLREPSHYVSFYSSDLSQK